MQFPSPYFFTESSFFPFPSVDFHLNPSVEKLSSSVMTSLAIFPTKHAVRGLTA